MKPGFFSALRHAAQTGELPDPSQPQASPLHAQLEASLAERQGPPELVQGSGALAPVAAPRAVPAQPVRTYRTQGSGGTATTAPRQPSPRNASSGSAAKKQTLEELFGGDDRASGDTLAQKPMQRCTTCEGSGIFQAGARRVVCGPCGGSGQVEVRQRKGPEPWPSGPRVASPPTGLQQLEQALARETDVPLPLEGAEDAATVEGLSDAARTRGAGAGADHPRTLPLQAVGAAGGAARAADEVSAVLEAGPATAAPAAITYDLPTSLADFPLFAYVCGPAGTGKTMLAKAWVASDPGGVVLAATTGIAAVNLGEGTTINALLRFYDLASLRDAYTGGWLEGQLKKLRASGLIRIVLDEVSMLDGDQLTIICRAIDNVNQDKREDDPELGLVLVGDFAQLSPVPNTVEGKKVPVTFAFESAEWGRFAAATYKLETIRRQGDLAFVQGLLAVRRGDADAALAVFGPHLQQTTLDQFPGTTILAKNEAVSKYNQLRLDKVTGEKVEFPSKRWGKLRGEWGGPPAAGSRSPAKPPSEWGIPDVLRLKVGAQVMVLANQNDADPGERPFYRYVNGDQGVLEAWEPGRAYVRLARTGEPVWVEQLRRFNEIPLEVGRAKALRAQGHPELINGKKEVLGWVDYMPLRLSYASTVHKSQGLSLDRVQISIRDHFFSTAGMLYTALSRCRTLEGLRVVGSPEAFRARCTVNPKIQPYL